MLDGDPGVEIIGLVSKGADPSVAEQVAELARDLVTPVVAISADRLGDDLTAGAGRLLDRLGQAMPQLRRWSGRDGTRRGGSLRGLYAGGTLCHEALLAAETDLGEVTAEDIESTDALPNTVRFYNTYDIRWSVTIDGVTLPAGTTGNRIYVTLADPIDPAPAGHADAQMRRDDLVVEVQRDVALECLPIRTGLAGRHHGSS